MGRNHDLGVSKAKGQLEAIINDICLTNFIIGNRRPDLGCGKNPTVITEVKTLKDLKTKRSQEQLCDIKELTEKKDQPATIYLNERNCYLPLNREGEKFIQRSNLLQCGRDGTLASLDDYVSCPVQAQE